MYSGFSWSFACSHRYGVYTIVHQLSFASDWFRDMGNLDDFASLTGLWVMVVALMDVSPDWEFAFTVAGTELYWVIF